MPTAVVENRSNGHAHVVWALSEPVTRTEYARRAPLAYAAAVMDGLRRAVDGDKGYSGLMTKNPTHDAWDTHWISTELRPLAALEHALEGHMPPESWRRTRRRKPGRPRPQLHHLRNRPHLGLPGRTTHPAAPRVRDARGQHGPAAHRDGARE